MSLLYFEPCPFCGTEHPKMWKPCEGIYLFECPECKALLRTMTKFATDAAATWNFRARRRALMNLQDMELVSLLYADIYDNQGGLPYINLPNTDENWCLVDASEHDCTIGDVNWVRMRPPQTEMILVKYEVIMDFLRKLIDEKADRLPELELEHE